MYKLLALFAIIASASAVAPAGWGWAGAWDGHHWNQAGLWNNAWNRGAWGGWGNAGWGNWNNAGHWGNNAWGWNRWNNAAAAGWGWNNAGWGHGLAAVVAAPAARVVAAPAVVATNALGWGAGLGRYGVGAWAGAHAGLGWAK